MKAFPFLALVLGTICVNAAESRYDTPNLATLGPCIDITGVMKSEDSTVLTVHYTLTGAAHHVSVTLTNRILEYRFCSYWLDRGVALALADQSNNFYWAAVKLNGYAGKSYSEIHPHLIASTPNHGLLGIANPVGDRIVVTALARFPGEKKAQGWMYFNSCPPLFDKPPRSPVVATGFHYLKTFEIP